MISYPKEKYIFIIETDSYAGNFERQLTAFCTGKIGGCRVGQEYAELFLRDCRKNIDMFDDVLYISDDHGTQRPTSVYGDPPNDVAIFFETEPDEQKINFLKKRALNFVFLSGFEKKYLKFKILGFKLIKETISEKIIWKS